MAPSTAARVYHQHSGAHSATTSAVFVSGDGKRVAVVLLNGNTLISGSALDPRAGNAVLAAANRLCCAA